MLSGWGLLGMRPPERSSAPLRARRGSSLWGSAPRAAVGSQASDLSRLVGSGGTALQFSKCPRSCGAGRADPHGRVYSAGQDAAPVGVRGEAEARRPPSGSKVFLVGFFPGNCGCRLRHCRRPDMRRFLDGSGAGGPGTLPATFPSVTSRGTGWVSDLRATLRRDVSVVWEIPVCWVWM